MEISIAFEAVLVLAIVSVGDGGWGDFRRQSIIAPSLSKRVRTFASRTLRRLTTVVDRIIERHLRGVELAQQGPKSGVPPHGSVGKRQ